MKIATYNVNGVNGRLEVLLRWLQEAEPDVVCLQELKAPQEKFPLKAIEAAGYGAVWLGQKSWNGVAILVRGQEPHLTRKGLPGDSEDVQSRYIEAIIDGVVVGGLYLPNGNPYAGPKFEYKLRWFERLHDYAAELLEREVPVILAGDYNVMPTELDVYKPERWTNDALFRVEVREAFKNLVDQGWTDALRELHPGERIYTFWDYFRNAYARSPQEEQTGSYLERYAVERLARTGVEKAAVAGLAKMTTRLIRKHPLVAAELFLSGASRAGEVGWQELAKQFKGRSTRRRKASHPVPLIPLQRKP